MSFQSFNFSPKILKAIELAGYQEPTPIQEKAIPPVMAGGDLIGLAQTGTGKTAAFALPILHRLSPRRRPAAPGGKGRGIRCGPWCSPRPAN